jgi:tetratricopeptide (TPR) repeat protein
VEARTLLEESQAISLSMGIEGELNLAETLNWLGLVKLFDNRDLQATRSMFEHSFELFQKWNDQRGIALSIFHLGILESASNHDEAALSLLEKSLSMHLKLGDQFFIARTSAFLGGTLMKQKNYEKSRRMFEQRLRLDQELQFWDGIADGWFDLGELFQIQNKYEQAFECYEASVAVCGEHGLRKSYAYYRSGLMALHLDNYSTALQRFIYLLDLAKKSSEMEKTGPLLFGLAAVAGGMNQPDRAALLWGSGTSLLKTTGAQLPEAEKQEFNRLIEEVRNQLGMAAFEEAGSRGQKMTLEQAIEYALETGR